VAVQKIILLEEPVVPEVEPHTPEDLEQAVQTLPVKVIQVEEVTNLVTVQTVHLVQGVELDKQVNVDGQFLVKAQKVEMVYLFQFLVLRLSTPEVAALRLTKTEQLLHHHMALAVLVVAAMVANILELLEAQEVLEMVLQVLIL
jgi:hypothetical protein